MLPLVFIGGAVTGAAGLLAAVLWDKNKTESQFSPLLKSPNKLDASQTAKQLNSYFFKAQGCYSKRNQIVIESCELIVTPIPLPDDNIFQRTANLLGGSANRYCRSWRTSQLRDIKDETKKPYDRYRGVFERANTLLAEMGKEPVDLGAIRYAGSSPQIDNSLANDNWDTEFQDFADEIREFIEQSCTAAERLIGILEQDSATIVLPDTRG